MCDSSLIMGQGVKRKLNEEEENSTVSQRQSILDISVGKLQIKSIKRVEPPLLKSVLILNTLKYIEAELLQEGMHSPTSCSTYTIPEVDPNSTVIDFLPEQDDHSKLNLPVSQTGPLPSIDTFVGPKSSYHELKLDSSVEKSPVSSVTDASLTTLYQSSVRMEEVLADLDFSVCDNDMFSCISSGTKLTPLSADEVLHSFPNTCSSGSENYTNLVNAVSPFCKSETAIDELDNIMQILVGS